jgi:phosphatidylglycerol---prolipoprotein diacylglyceryl transferase
LYPNLYYAFRDLFGIEWKPLRYINSFGFFVAVAFILAAVVLAAELKRKSKQGLLQPTEINVMVGKPASASELLLNFLLGFVLGYKILALFLMNSSATDDPQAFIFSLRGSWPAGIGLGLLFAWVKWREKDKQKLPKPELRKIRFWPHDRVGEITIIALVFGLVGAKIFDVFENWRSFIKDPASIISPSGLTFYGGLICAAVAIWIYARKHKIGFWHLNDAAAPALMLAYAIGRIGCQVSGDGDWGIYNSAFAVDGNANITKATPGRFEQTLRSDSATIAFFLDEHPEGLDKVPHKSFGPESLDFLPDWMLAYDYPHNVNNAGVKLANCTDNKYCEHLPVPVFPTSFYEMVICLLLFLILWALRRKLKIPGTLFAVYLMMNGVERFFIEKIRVNNRMNLLGLQPTQAELISALLFLAGLLIFILLRKRVAVPNS